MAVEKQEQFFDIHLLPKVLSGPEILSGSADGSKKQCQGSDRHVKEDF